MGSTNKGATRERIVSMTAARARAIARTQAPLKRPSDDVVEAAANADPDAPLSTVAQLDGARIVESPNKVPVNLRIDPGVLAAYKAAGAGWQTRMHDALRAGVLEMRGARPDPVETIALSLQTAMREVEQLRATVHGKTAAGKLTAKRQRGVVVPVAPTTGSKRSRA